MHTGGDQKTPPGKQRAVERDAFSHAQGKEKKITCRDQPGKDAEKPQPQPPGEKE